MNPNTATVNNNLISFDWNVDNVKQGDQILFRYADDVLTEAKLISNHRGIPEPNGSVRYDTLLLDTFVGLNIKDWDGHSAMTTFLRPDGEYDHSVKIGATTAAGAAA
jgi:hypothetical protein